MTAKTDEPNPKDLIGIKKVPLGLVPPASNIEQARAMRDGALKYGAYNWREHPVKATVYINAAKRHIDAWQDGEEYSDDTDPPVHHLGHALACLGIIVDAMHSGNMIDDRPLPGPAADLLRKYKLGE